MTTEEKAKAYDEAIEKVKPLYEQAKKDCNPIWSTYEYLIPELAESEDEEMRQELVTAFKSLGPMWFGLNTKDILAWLEKQKEQKLVQTEDEKEYVRILKSLVSDFIRDHYKNVDITFYQKIYDWLDGRHVEQKEQKPAERSLEDDHIIGFVYDLLNEIEWKDNWAMSKEECLRLLNNYSPQKPAEIIKPEKGGWYICIKDFYAGGKKCASVGDLVQAKAGMYMMGREDISKWFRKAYYDELNPFDGAIYHNQYVKRQDYSELTDIEKAIHRGFLCAGVENVPVTIIKETAQDCLAQIKPAEWSDTDNIGWDEAFACVTRAEKSAKNEEELQNAVTAEKWLKEIKFKYCVHPVKQEWSEEDEKMMNEIITIMDGGKVTSGTYLSEYAAWLKSIRPSWKPSEEQMSALLAIFNDTNNIGSQTCQLALTDLYEQLKKLKGE